MLYALEIQFMKIKAPLFNPKQLRRIIAAELAEHPKTHYTDIYKLIHQASFGPSHLEDSLEAIEAGIWDELKTVRSCAGKTHQDIGLGRGFMRLNFFALSRLPSLDISQTNTLRDQLVRDALTRVNPSYVKLFAQAVHASRLPEPIDPEEWLDIWKTAVPIVMSFIFPTLSERARVDYCLASGTLPSHSEDYKYLYKPHYRVIHIKNRPKFKA